jgi:amino-acid N-acetyltransferase
VTALPVVPSGDQGAGSSTLGSRGPAAAPRGPAPRSLLAIVRPARLADVPALQVLQAPYVATGDLLPRSEYDLCRHIKEWVVVDAAGDGSLIGCGALKIYSHELGELAGLAVRRDQQGAGLGRALVEALVAEAQDHGLAQVFALTRKPDFFLRLGFRPAAKEQFPQKVWADCAKCPRQNCCDEIAVALRL